jgi:hypothetical protein
MKLTKALIALSVATSLSACFSEESGGEITDKTMDHGYDSKHLSQLKAGIWVDPNGCDHWIIDDGNEGYLSQRLDRYGKPVCSGIAPPGTATGPYKEGTIFNDPA